VSGHGQLPPPGEPYTVAVLFPSRKVPSWFFGDGTLLFKALVMGGGLLRPLGGRGGIRIDARVHVIQDRTVTRVTAAPSVGSDIPIIVVRAATPTVVFSASPQIQTSLSAPLTDFETFTGSGTRTQFSFTAGYYFRF